MEKCVSFCCEDIRPFNIINGEEFEELAQELINVGAVYGMVLVIPSHVTIAKRCRRKEGSFSADTEDFVEGWDSTVHYRHVDRRILEN